jgi:hypothetical protein
MRDEKTAKVLLKEFFHEYRGRPAFPFPLFNAFFVNFHPFAGCPSFVSAGA